MNITKEQRKKISHELRNSHQSIRIGRSHNSAGFGSGTPVVVVEGDTPPSLEGQPYLKTIFRNGPKFTKTLYTPSTLHAVVGKNWLEKISN
jgi:hypothetical protein